ncbi:MAG: hypothetical protein WC807_18440 [Hyphomicrobium sp.]|jgi:hypothetical protein
MPNVFDQFDAAPSQPQGLVGRQTLGPYPRPAPQQTQNVFDQFDSPASMAQMAAQSFRQLPGQPADAMLDPSAPEPQAQPQSSAARMYQGEQEYQIAARQSTSQDVRNPQGDLARPVLGKAYQMDDGYVYFDGPDGRPVQADKAQHVVLRDPQTNEQMVFARTPETDQSGFFGKALSLGQVMAPGMATSPVTGVGRGAGITNATRNAQAANEIEQDAAAFDRLGVRPFGPAFSSGPVGAAAKQVTELPFVGGPTRQALTESIEGTRDASRAVAGRYGTSTTAQEAGNVAQQGLERFKDARPADVLDDAARNLSPDQLSRTIAAPARETSLKSKQAALYERAWRLIPQEMQRGRAVQGQARVMGNPQNTRRVIEGIVQRNMRMTNQAQAAREGSDAVANPVRGGLLGRIIEAVRTPQWTANLQTLRDMRSDFRRLASGMSDTERNTLKLSDLDAIQSGITEDMIALLQRNAESYRAAGDTATAAGFERSIREFRRADQFTRLSKERLESIERLFRAESSEALARNITQAALAGGRGNEQLLATLRRTLRSDEMGEVAASIISEMGRPVGSARGETQRIGFSVNSFLTKWQNMSDRSKALLFDGEHRAALDDLLRVVSRNANVEALGNSSRTLSNATGIGSIGAAGALVTQGAGAMVSGLGTAGALAGASFLFSRPSYVRWVTRYLRAKEAARRPQGGGRVTAALNELGRMAVSDPDLVPILQSLVSGQTAPNPPGQQ